MPFNLGLTADAAAAHKNEVVGLESESRPVHHSFPATLSLTLPLLGLGSLYSSHKGVQADTSQPGLHRAMAMSAEGSVASSDGESSTSEPQTPSARKQSSRPKTSYHLAHPAGGVRNRRLNFRPKLVLQLQRVSQTPRPLPVLDVLPSTLYLPRLARRFPTIFRGKKGLGPNDLIVVKSDLYDRTGGDIARKYLGSDDEHGDQQEVVATICQLLKEDALLKGKAEICLNYGPVWEATPLSNGSYEFVANTEYGIQILRWVLRGDRSRRVSALPWSSTQEDSRRFTFSVIDLTKRRHPVIASLTKNHLEVYDEYSMPTSGVTFPTCAMSVGSDSSEMDVSLDRRVIETDEHLRTLIILTSIWVAFREGWSYNFSYNDSAMIVGCPKGLCSPIASRPSSITASKPENNQMMTLPPDTPIPNGSKHRLSGSYASSTQTNSPSDRSIAFGSLSKRSNSTGAAFMERTNRRASRPQQKRPVPESERSFGDRGQSPDQPEYTEQRRLRPSDASPEAMPMTLHRNVEPGPAKEKRRHRLSSIFEFLAGKSSHY